MYQASDLKNGVIFIYNNEPFKVLSYKHTHMGRQGANITVKIRGLISGSVLPVTMSPNERFEQADLKKKKMQFLYREGKELFFMDMKNYEQTEINENVIGDEADFLQDGKDYELIFWDEKPLSIEIPPKIVVEVIECAPGVKGNSAANMYKSAKVTGNISVKVPLFVEQGEKIRIDTVNRKYVERAK